MIRSSHALIAASLLALLLSSATARQAESERADNGQDAAVEPDAEIIDEVTVLGVRELAHLRAEVIRAEDVVYDLYNDLNEDDKYDIVCKKETRIGSQIPRRICQARLFRDAVADATEDIEGGEDLTGAMVNSAKHNAILREKMAALASEHPELLVALKKRLELSKKFEQERARKFD